MLLLNIPIFQTVYTQNKKIYKSGKKWYIDKVDFSNGGF